jgi:hypothetical protein
MKAGDRKWSAVWYFEGNLAEFSERKEGEEIEEENGRNAVGGFEAVEAVVHVVGY